MFNVTLTGLLGTTAMQVLQLGGLRSHSDNKSPLPIPPLHPQKHPNDPNIGIGIQQDLAVSEV